MTNKKLPSLAAALGLAALMSLPMAAHSTIAVTSVGISGATSTVDFSIDMPDNTEVTTQYAGLTFTATAGGAVRANGCSAGAWSDNIYSATYINTFGPDCAGNTVDDSFSLKFSHAVSAASFQLLDFRADGSNVFTALLGGSVIEAFVHDGSNDSDSSPYIYGSPAFLAFTNLIFDEIRYTEGHFSEGAFLIMTDLRSISANAVPEPSSLALVALALAGLAVRRRSKA